MFRRPQTLAMGASILWSLLVERIERLARGHPPVGKCATPRAQHEQRLLQRTEGANHCPASDRPKVEDGLLDGMVPATG